MLASIFLEKESTKEIHPYTVRDDALEVTKTPSWTVFLESSYLFRRTTTSAQFSLSCAA